ncbi:uncharacterized protein LOC124680640 isoform X2 [Lolium rigidum]|uniref:uncharacterized protein LOC124680640 isoform X2 n=1 Tax=Lolium rigidum TaxID=89674 RepID=UPI001F5C69E5|nr:uncharacterized protein LOC124680640 isoform X2 [Lolium rigidum]
MLVFFGGFHFRLSMVRWSQSTWWTCGQGTTPTTLASGSSSALAIISSISFCSSSSNNDDGKLEKPMTEAMDELYGEAPLQEPVVNGINTRFALCSSMSDQRLHRHRRWDRSAAPHLRASNCPEDNAKEGERRIRDCLIVYLMLRICALYKAQGYPARQLCSVQCANVSTKVRDLDDCQKFEVEAN